MTDNAADQEFNTVFNRIYQPTADCFIYHYCSTPTLLSIIEEGKLRFSDVNMMNDPLEWRYAYELFERGASALLRMAVANPALEGLTTDFFDQIDTYISPKQLRAHPVITCFSKQADVLSQWRGYADGARGWSIGFDATAISQMPVTLLDVLYDADQQVVEVRNYLAAMFLTWRENDGVFGRDFSSDAILLASYLLAYKHPSFREEQEIRALHELRVDVAEDGCQLIDEGGVVRGADVQGQPVRFRAADGGIVAYVDIPLERNDEGRSIRELWFGPANSNGPGNVLYPLTQYGHRGVKFHWSASAFRP